MNEEFYQILAFRGSAEHLRRICNRYDLEAKQAWLRERYGEHYTNVPKRCEVCNVPTAKSHKSYRSKTLDHIIPIRMLEQLEMPELLWDFDNYRLLCRACNEDKSHQPIPDEELPPALRDKFHALLNERLKLKKRKPHCWRVALG